MSTATLTNLRDYLTGTLSPANMLWLSTQLADFAKKKEKDLYTPEEAYELTMKDIKAIYDEKDAI